MEKFSAVLRILRIAVEALVLVLLVLYIKEYREKALTQMEEG